MGNKINAICLVYVTEDTSCHVLGFWYRTKMHSEAEINNDNLFSAEIGAEITNGSGS